MFEIFLYILSLIAVLFIGFYIGWLSREKYAQKILDKYYDQIDTALKLTTMNIDVIKQNDNKFFVYNSDNGSFITYVNNKDELSSFLKKEYPTKTVLMKKQHLEELEQNELL